MPIHKIQRELRANKPKLICSVLRCAVWEIIVIKAFNCNTLLTFSALRKVKLNAMLLLYCLWCQYYACWTNKHNHLKINSNYAVKFVDFLHNLSLSHWIVFDMIDCQNMLISCILCLSYLIYFSKATFSTSSQENHQMYCQFFVKQSLSSHALSVFENFHHWLHVPCDKHQLLQFVD